MKTLFCLIFHFVFISLAMLNAASLPVQHELNSAWEFKQARLSNWHPATVPGVVHTDLLNNKLIEDPFFRLNERGLQWIDKEDWVYRTTFDLPQDMIGKRNIRLDFNGLDTYADVYLNEVKILSANNMFRNWKIDITAIVKQHHNTLRVYFHSPIKIDMPKWEALPFHYEAGNDQSENGGIFNRRLSVFARKAGYHYGWDWGPRFVTSGIWRPVVLEAWDDVHIQNVEVLQPLVDKQQASIKTIVEIQSDMDLNDAIVAVNDNDNGKLYGSLKTPLQKGLNKIEVSFTIKNPQLWWSNGLGNPHLYHFRTSVSTASAILDRDIENIGIRSLKLVHQPDKYGHTFYFVLNDVPVFMKGADYIPCDNFLPRVTPYIYKRTILDAVNANMNMLRVWGGGIYENDIFYDLCDQYGILIWQDFMFACSLYPAEGEWLENVRQEAIDNVKRLRNHPCLAIWCGNNECNDGWFSWGWKKEYEKQNPAYADTIWKQFSNQYYNVLPAVVKEYAPESFYWPSSPFASKDGPSDDKNGDRHYWGVWHGKEPIENFNKIRSRFFTEYGFQSFPELCSVKKYAPEKEDWDIRSDVMMAHQRGGEHANGLIETYLLGEYRKPKDFTSFLYMNQILQGDAIKTAIEAHRRDRPYCMGTLFWQHNDCWPVASWSSRDYYGRWKAQHYFAREAYKEVLVSPITEDNMLNVYAISDRLKGFKADLSIEVLSLDGKMVFQSKKTVTISPLSSKVVFTSVVNALLNGNDKGNVVIHTELTEKGKIITQNNYFLVQQKDMNYPKTEILKSIKPINGGFEITLSTDKFARGVYLSLEGTDNFFQNNYFDIFPGKPITTTVTTTLSQTEFEKQLTITSLSAGY